MAGRKKKPDQDQPPLEGEIILPGERSGEGDGAKYAGSNKGGRPHASLDWKLIDNLLLIQCTQAEIAAVLEVDPDTITAACQREQGMLFRKYSAAKRGVGKVSLRRRQWKTAMAGDGPQHVRMQIHLGRHVLDQRERHEVTGANGNAIELATTVDMKKLSDAALREIIEAGVAETDQDEDDEE